MEGERNPFSDDDSESDGDATPSIAQLPTPVQLNRRSSSFIRRLQIKQNHCLFCHHEVNRTNFENHLRGSERCLSLYKRKLHVRTIDSILIKSFYCLFCTIKSSSKFQHHLEQNPGCLERYLDKFQVDSMRKVTQKIGNLKREGYKSRNSDSRSKENKKLRQEKAQSVSQDSARNNFLSRTAFSNVVKCIYCKCNKFESEAVVLSEEDIVVEGVENLRRFQKFWKCKSCSTDIRTFKYPLEIVPFDSRSFGGKVLFTPIKDIEPRVGSTDSQSEGENLDQNEALSQEGAEEIAETVNNSIVLDKKIAVSFPCSFNSLSISNRNLPRSVADILLLAHNGEYFTKKDIEVFYLNQLLKYKQVESTGDRFLGKIMNHEDRTLSKVIKQANDGVIHGSYKWRQDRNEEITLMLKQTGEMAFTLEFSIPLDDQAVVSSSLIQQGLVLSVSYHGSGDLQQDRKYYVHTDHNCSVDCQDNCPKTELSTWNIEGGYDTRNLNNRDAPCYIAAVSQRLDAFIQEILKCQSSPLYSKEYYFWIKFRSDGVAIVQGVFWPLFLEKINHDLATKSIRQVEKKILIDLANDLDKAVSCSSDIQVTQAQFELSNIGTRSLVDNVKKFQVQIDTGDDREMPSLMTIICEVPEKLENLPVSKRLLQWIKQELNSLSPEELAETSTHQFLENLYDNIDESSEVVINGRHDEFWKLVIDDEEYIFVVESKLKEFMDQFQNLLMAPFYHFALWCLDPEEKILVILKRLMLSDIHTNSYNPLFLKACDSSILVKPCFYSEPHWEMSTDPEAGPGDSDPGLGEVGAGSPEVGQSQVSGPIEVDAEGDERGPGPADILPDHEAISFQEVLALADSKKMRIRSSRPFGFVYSGPSKMLLLKKVPEFNESCFQVDGLVGIFFETQPTIVSRYFSRLNGKNMLLSEFAIFFEYIGADESQKMFGMLRANMDTTSNSEHQASIIEGTPYPDFVLCENGDVLKRRKRFKILKYPSYDPESFDFKHSKVLLFYYPLGGLEYITEENIDNFYESVNGDNLKMVEENEKLFLQNLRKPD